MEKSFSYLEEFDDGVLNADNWSYTGTSVAEHSGYLDIQQAVTDAGGIAKLSFSEGISDASIRYSSLLHANGNYFFGGNQLTFTSSSGEVFYANLDWLKSDYGPDYGNEASNYNRPRIDFGNGDGWVRSFSDNVLSSSLYDTWNVSTFKIDNVLGRIQIDMNGDGSMEFDFEDTRLVGATLTEILFNSYGWGPGHYQYVDSLSVTGTVADSGSHSFTEPELQKFGTLWDSLVLANAVYSDAMKGVIAGWRNLNPYFAKNSTAIDAIFEASIWDSVGLYGDDFSDLVYADIIKAAQKVKTKDAFIQAIRDGEFSFGVDGNKALEFAGNFIEVADTVAQGYGAIKGLLDEADVDGAFDTIESLATSLLTGGAVSLSLSSGVAVTIGGIVGATGLASVLVVGGVTIGVGLGAAKLISELNDHYRITEGVSAWYKTALIEQATNGGFKFSADTTPRTVVGDYLISGGQGDDNLKGGVFDDNLSGSGGDDVLDGGAGADTMFGGTGNDIYIIDNKGDKVVEVDLSLFSEDIDTVRASVSFKAPTDVDNIVLLGKKNINAVGNNEDNRIWGNSGNNRIESGRGEDVVRAKGGNDIVVAANDIHEDSYFGGKGNDTLVFAAKNSISGVNINLSKTVAYTAFGTENYYDFENLTGTRNSDVLIGDQKGNILKGREGGDILRGAGGADTLVGGSGKDVMYAGKDKAADVFVFNAYTDSKVGFLGRKADKIFLFDTGEDKLDLSGIDANTSLKGNQAFELDIVSSVPTPHGIWVKYTTRGDVLVYADVNGDDSADMLIKLIGLDSISVNDFIL